MTSEQEALLRKTLSAVENLNRDVAVISKALSYTATKVDKKEKDDDIENMIIANVILKGRQNRKVQN